MKKKVTFFIKIFILVILSMGLLYSSQGKSVLANSEPSENKEESLLDEKEIEDELNKLYDYINSMKSDEELLNDLNPSEYIKAYLETGEGNFSINKISDAVVSFIFRELKTILALAISIIVIGIISSLLKNLQGAFSSEGISQIAFFACYALLIVMLSRSFLISVQLAKDVILKMTDFMSALLPVLVIMLGTAGGLSQAATMDPIVLGATFIIPNVYSNIIIPLILVSFVLQFANNITTEPKLDNLCKFVKQISLWIQGFALTVFIGILTIRGITASTIDAVTLKTTKFAIDNFIPIVGKSFGDAISSVAGYALIIKNAISTVGLVVVICIILYPIIKMILMSFIYKFSAAILEPITDKRITKSIAATGESIILLLSCVLSVSLMFFILIGIMASAGKFVLGG